LSRPGASARSGDGYRFLLHPSPFGEFAVIWVEEPGGVAIRRIVLPRSGSTRECGMAFPGGRCAHHRSAEALAADVARFLDGENVTFDLSRVALSSCSEFQQRVLRAEHAIPRGRVSSYGAIARHLGQPRGARAVGRALATNPFPVVVPCHRAIRGDGTLGGYQGGVEMKRALLEMEGLRISSDGRVLDAVRHYE
jgi:methylated-DNA-[protein]-cysteine S-methyltransferase